MNITLSIIEHPFAIQVLSLIGAFVVLTAYVGHQLKWKLFNPEKYFYNFCNAFAAVFLTFAAFHPFQVGFVIMESAWGMISAYTMYRIYKKK